MRSCLTAFSVSGARVGNGDRKRRAFSRGSVEVQGSAEPFDAFGHALKTQMFRPIHLSRFETPSVILYA